MADEEIKKEEEQEEVKPEEPKEEEVKPDVDAVINEEAAKAADKILDAINTKMAAQKDAEVAAKKAKVFPNDTKVYATEVKQKIYQTRKGVDVYATKDEAVNIAKWFKHLVMFKKTKSPHEFAEMEKAFHVCEQIAVQQKLEPLNTVTAGDGGNLVPTIMYNKIVPFLEDLAQIKQRSYVIDATGIKTLDVPNIAAGAYVNWNSETAQKATTSMQFGHQTLTPYILAGIIVITQQLIDDAPFAMLQIVSQELARAIAKAEDAAFASGSGTGQPTGIDTYTPIGTVAAGGALAFNHFLTALYLMPQAYRSSSSLVWLMHRNNILLTAGLADTTGRPIFDNMNPMSNILGTPRTPQVLGIPVIENNDISEKTIYLVDLQNYWIAQSRQLSIDIATEATIGGVIDSGKGAGYYVAGNNLWERNEIAIRAEEKIDGELVTTRALTTITSTRP
jgi:HK97 family phage major capsid protein